MQSLRSLEERLLSLPVMLKSTIFTLNQLRAMNEDLRQALASSDSDRGSADHALKAMLCRIQSYLDTAKVLRDRVDCLGKLVS